MAKTDRAQVPSGEKGCGRKTISKVSGAAEEYLFPQFIQIYSWKKNREEGEENL